MKPRGAPMTQEIHAAYKVHRRSLMSGKLYLPCIWSTNVKMTGPRIHGKAEDRKRSIMHFNM